jgi:serine/threonine protein kinase
MKYQMFDALAASVVESSASMFWFSSATNMRSNLPTRDYFVGKTVPTRPDILVNEFKESGNDGHLFKGHSDLLKRDVACKVIPRSNLQHGPNGEKTWFAEVHKADALRNPTVVKFEGVAEWRDNAAGIDCIVFISEFVEGISLRKFIDTYPDEISIEFVRHWFATMLNLLYEMKVRGVDHGDLHSGNILVEDRSSYDIMGPRFVFRVTDFGVADATSDRRFKDDYFQIADTLAALLRKVEINSLGPKERFIFNVLRNDFVSRHLVEMDVTRDPIARNPADLLKRLRTLDTDFESATNEDSRLVTPFDFLSCEQIGESSTLLRALYSDRFLGLGEIESQNNVVVTGPRGCGKSTVFRSLSLDQRLRTNEATPDGIKYIGVYYQCNDLYFAFPRYKAPANEAAIDIPLHFVTATLLAKLLDVVDAWGRAYFADQFTRSESSAAAMLWETIRIKPPNSPTASSLRVLIEALYKQRVRAAEHHRFASDPKRTVGSLFGAEVLQQACKVLVECFPFLRERPIYFFIDDYSHPKVTKPMQASLNRLFMQRTPYCFFKLSTESPVSFERSDIDTKNYVEGREFVLQNLGIVYLHADFVPKITFIDDIFRRRFTQAQNFPVQDLDQLIGECDVHNQNEMARSIRAGEKPLLWGKGALCNLCSGDVHYLISLVGDMVRQAGGPAAIQNEHAPRVQPALQNRSIREAAGSFLRNLRSIPKCGERLVAIVEAFGNVAHSHLKFFDSKNEDNSPPKQATRIEPYEPFALAEDAQEIYEELLRYSVFIEDFRGKSRRGSVVPRLYLRRFLIPHFNLTFSTRDSIELEPHDFELFLQDPKRFESKFRPKTTEDANRLEDQAVKSVQQLSFKLHKEQ